MTKNAVATVLAILLTGPLTVACAQEGGQEAASGGDGLTQEVVARIGERAITGQELEDKLGAQLSRLRQQEYDLRSKALKELVIDLLAEEAAQKQGISKEEFYRLNVEEKVGEPAEEQIEATLAQYRSRLPDDEEQARARVVDFLRQQQVGARQQALSQELMDAADVVFLLEPPRVEVRVDPEDPVRGAKDAAVTIVEFSDFQCPYCNRVQQSLDRILQEYGDRVQLVFKQFPLGNHPEARPAAEATLCAKDQGKFWEMHDWVFGNQRQLQREGYIGEAKELGLDVELFTACLDDHRHTAQVDLNGEQGKSWGVTGTPAAFVNGRFMSGAQPYESFRDVVVDELKKAGLPTEPLEKPENDAEGETEAEA